MGILGCFARASGRSVEGLVRLGLSWTHRVYVGLRAQEFGILYRGYASTVPGFWAGLGM